MLHMQCVAQLRLKSLRSHLRWLSTKAARDPERVVVPCKNNGFVNLEIHRPTIDQDVNSEPFPRPIILHVPRGPAISPHWVAKSSQSKDDQAALETEVSATLADASKAIVVQVNYRLTHEARFPTPLHDVLVAYDWAVTHFGGQKPSAPHEEPGSSKSVGYHTTRKANIYTPETQVRVGVCGDLFGGTLALSLALSECHLPAPDSTRLTGRVVAAAVCNPIVNWIFDQYSQSEDDSRKSRRSKSIQTGDDSASSSAEADTAQSQHLTTDDLTSIRRAVFYPSRTAEWFDQFASPLFFLRTPGVEVSEIDKRNTQTSSTAYTDPDSIIDFDDETPNFLTADRNIPSPSYADLSADDTVDIPTPPPDDPTRQPIAPTALPTSAPASTSPFTLGSTTTSPARQRPYRPRRVPRRFPPPSTAPHAAFPSFRFRVPAPSALSPQTAEMAALLRRALARFEGLPPPGSTDDAGQADARAAAYLAARVALLEHGRDAGESAVAWDVREAAEVGRWFAEVFAQGGRGAAESAVAVAGAGGSQARERRRGVEGGDEKARL